MTDAVAPAPPAPAPAAPALAIERLTVRADRIICDVAVSPGIPHLTTPALAARVREAFPSVPRHACVNDEGDTFAAVMDCTPLPHMLEHLVIDLQTRAYLQTSPAPSSVSAAPALSVTSAAPAHSPAPAVPPVMYVGTTEWTDEHAGRARVEVSFTDDLVALRAFRDAADFLNRVVVP